MEETPPSRPSPLGFGLDRIGLLALRYYRFAALAVVLITAVTAYGFPHVSIDRDLRNLFRGDTAIFNSYTEVVDQYVDPENQVLILIEGASLGEPGTFASLRDLHIDLSLLPDVGSVFSPFSLRTPPDANGNTRPLIADAAAGLTPDLTAAIRSHPILGANILSADGTTMLMIVTHAQAQATLDQVNELIAEVQDTVAQDIGGADVKATIAGFAPMRAEIVRLLRRDQIVLNGAGVIIGFILSLILFRSLSGAVITALPAAFAGLTLLGWTGALGIQVTILSNVVPALVMVLGYADGMHLTASWRRFRQKGYSVLEAERLALFEVGPACMLTALTTAVAFLSMTLSDVGIVKDFGWIGAIGTILGAAFVLVGHGLLVRWFGRFWRVEGRTASNLFNWLGAPAAGLTRWVTGRAWTLSIISVPVTLVLGAAFFAVPAEHSLSETLPPTNPMVQSLHTIDAELGGAFPVQIIVPLGGVAANSPEGLAKIRAVHEAVAAVSTASPPLSLWSLAEWAGVGDGGQPSLLLSDLPEATQRLFTGAPGALVTVYIVERPTAETAAIVNEIEAAAQSVAPDAIVTGATVVGAREATRTIGNLNRSLGLAALTALTLVAIALRSVSAGLVAALPNLLPIVGVGALLYALGLGMQLTSVVSLTIAFGIAIDDTIHYLNVLFLTRNGTLRERMISSSRTVGPVLIGTTVVLIGGLTMTQSSGLATIALFGLLAISSLAVALVGDLIFLPAIIFGPGRRLFERRQKRDERRRGGD